MLVQVILSSSEKKGQGHTPQEIIMEVHAVFSDGWN